MSAIAIFQDQKIKEAKATGAEMFMGIPDAWYEPPHWGCDNGHVSRAYLKTRDGCACLECHKPLAIIPGGYTDETLSEALAKINNDVTLVAQGKA